MHSVLNGRSSPIEPFRGMQCTSIQCTVYIDRQQIKETISNCLPSMSYIVCIQTWKQFSRHFYCTQKEVFPPFLPNSKRSFPAISDLCHSVLYCTLYSVHLQGQINTAKLALVHCNLTILKLRPQYMYVCRTAMYIIVHNYYSGLRAEYS